MNARKHQILTLTNSAGSVSHTDADGKTVTRIAIGHLWKPSIHIYGFSGHTVRIWGTNETQPADATNAAQLGVDITATALVVIEEGPEWIFIEMDVAGSGNPTAILSGRVE